MQKDEYLKVLGLPSRSSLDEIKSAKRSLLMKNHPDLNPDAQVSARRRTQEILEAYDALMSMWEEPAPSMASSPRPSYAGHSAHHHATPETRHKSFLIFHIGDVSLALDAAEILEIIPLGRLLQEGGASPVPNRVLWRGKSTILVDPRRALRIACTETLRRAKVIVSSFRGAPVGLIVDEVDGLRKVAESDIRPDTGSASIPQGLCRGMVCTDEGQVPLLSLEKVLTN